MLRYTKDNPLKVFTAFSGYDSQCLGLERLKDYAGDFSYELIGWSEIEKNAITAHNALFPQYSELNYGDISKIDWNEVPDFDLFTYSSPCQDFSAAGLQKGGTEGTGTRSSLLWECRRCIEAKRPAFLLFENVTGLLTSKFYDLFQKWIRTVNAFGYSSTFRVLNAADYGIPQNRERVFLVSVRNGIDVKFTFPAAISRENMHLYDYLDPFDSIDEKYFRSDERREHFMEMNKKHIDKYESEGDKHSNGFYDIIPCGLYCHCSDDFIRPPLYDISRTLKSETIDAGIIYKKDGKWEERLLTPHECLILMGLTEEEYQKINEKMTLSAQAKIAGNSIVVNVLFHLFRKMFVDNDKPDIGESNVLF